MGLNDKAEAVKDVRETKEARGEGVEQTIADAHGDKAMAGVKAQQMSDFLALKTNIDKVKVGDKEVDLKDGKHEKERGAIKDAAKAMESGDPKALSKAFDGLSPEQAKVVAAGLDKALKPGGRVQYDGESKTIDIYSGAKPEGNKTMVPLDGREPRRGSSETPYYEEASGTAKPEDLTKVVQDAKKGDADRKAAFGLTGDRGMSAAPLAPTMDLKMDRTDAKADAPPPTFGARMEAKGDVPPPPKIEVRSGRDLNDQNMKNEGIQSESGTRGTYVEFPNGVKVDALKERTTTVTLEGEQPTTHVHPAEIRVDGAEEKPAGSGSYVDAAGKQVAKTQADGSVRVWTDNGVYNVYPGGEVTKEMAVKQRDGSWKIYDDKSPLGNLRVPKS